MDQIKYKHRDINWLYFNERVLLQAADTNTPLLERLKFLAIFSSNLDEYFKVRVSQLRQLKQVDKTLRKKLILKANKKLKFILAEIDSQQEYFGKIFAEILEELKKHNIFFENHDSLSKEQLVFINSLFTETIQRDIDTLTREDSIFLQDGHLYLMVLFEDGNYNFVHIPTEAYGRFIKIPGPDAHFIFLDDIIKLNLTQIFPKQTITGSYAIKLSRDAELYLEDDFTDTALVEKIYKSLDKRQTGQPTRLLYDNSMPQEWQEILRKQLDIGKVDMFPGGKYHNLSDFFSFENPTDNPRLSYIKKEPLPHPYLSDSKNLFKTISEKDQLIHFPYQQFSVVEKFIMEASKDANVTFIKISLYRIAETSTLTDALLTALDKGKEVTIFVEAKARFDEENNIKWGKKFQDKGAKVFFSVPNIKVHSKIALIERIEDGKPKRYAYIGTGNFNAKTAKLYCDHGLFTKHKKITKDLNQVFLVLEKKLIIPKLKYLLASPYNTRSTFMELIDSEIKNSLAGKKAAIKLKMNSLEDTRMINALYRASEAGVHIELLVRGFCCLVQRETEGDSKIVPIRAISVVDRYLEHARVYWFLHGGEEKMYMGSADWMTRNLDRRIEVLTPLLDPDIFRELKDILDIQLSDNVKARIFDKEDSNKPVALEDGEKEIRSQYAIYDYLKKKATNETG